MPPRIEQTPLAFRDIDELAEYYRTEAGFTVALRFLDNVQYAFERLAEMPRMGAVVAFRQASHAGIRRWHIDGFPRLVILYRALHDGVEVIRVIDAGRDIQALFIDPEFSS